MRAKKKGTEIRRDEIAQAALNLVAGQGLRALTVGRVAQLVGFSPSAIYRHFRGKADIIDAMLDLLHARVVANVAEARKETNNPLERIQKLLMRHLQLMMEIQAIPRIFFSEDVYRSGRVRLDKVHRIVTALLGGVEEFVRDGQENGRIRKDYPATVLALIFLGLFQPAAFLWHISGGTFDLVHQVDAAWRVYVDAVQVKSRKGKKLRL